MFPRVPAAILTFALCVAFAHTSDAAVGSRPAPALDDRKHSADGPAVITPKTRHAQNPAQPHPTPAPVVRPRTVSPSEGAGRQSPPPQAAPPPQATQPAVASPQAQPARTDNPDPRPPGSAPSQSPEEVDEDEVVRVDSNLVIIPASVLDSRGRAITDLKVEDFELRVDGEVKPIGDLSRAETPVHIALLFDNSASLSAAREFEKQAAVRFFRSVVRPIDRAAVYSISTVPTLSQGLTNDVSRLVRTVERFGAPDGATALFDAVAQAADYMRPLPGRKVLVVVSDGTDTVSDTSFEEAVNRALRAECQVYVVQTRQVEDPSLHDPVSEQRMQRLSEQTGGAVYVPKTVDELDAVFAQVSLDLSQQYLLSYYPQDDRKDKYFRFISLRVKTRPTLRVRARKGFYPESAQAQPGAKGTGTQFSGSLTNTRAEVASATAPSPGEVAASYRRTAAEAAPAAREAAPRTKQGPDGPDTEESSKPKQVANDPVPTFALTASGPGGTAKASNAAPAPPAARERADANTAAGTNLFSTPAPAPAVPSPSPSKAETAAAPTSTPANVDEKGDAKAPAGQQAAAAPQAGNTTGAAERERPKTPISGGVLNSKAISLPRPNYPSAAKNSGAAGTVVVEVTIDEQGKIVEARAVSGHPFLQQAAVQAARQARFSPATLSGEPVRVKGTISYVFTLP